MLNFKGVFILTVLCLSTLVALNASAETLENAGFEAGDSSWYNWSYQDNKGVVSDEYSYNGLYSACREILGEGMGCYGQVIKVGSKDIVSASVWVMNPSSESLTDGAEGLLRIEFWNETQPLGNNYVESESIRQPTEWKKLKVSGIAPVGAVEARILAFSRGGQSSGGKVYFDDFEINIKKAGE